MSAINTNPPRFPFWILEAVLLGIIIGLAVLLVDKV